jgi:hypothetical protein
MERTDGVVVAFCFRLGVDRARVFPSLGKSAGV